MRKNGVLIVILVIAAVALLLPRLRGPAPTPAVFGAGLTLDAAETLSAEQNKPVLAFLTADWCGPCQAFKRGAWSDESVAALIRERAIPVYVNVDESPDARRFDRVTAVPTTIIEYEGRELGRIEGGMGATAFRSWLETTLARADSAPDEPRP